MEKDGAITVKLRFNGEHGVQEKLNLASNNQASFKRKSHGQMQRDKKRADKFQQNSSMTDNNDITTHDIETPRIEESFNSLCMSVPNTPASISQVISYDNSTPSDLSVNDPLLMDKSLSYTPLPSLACIHDQDNATSGPSMSSADEHVNENSASDNVTDEPHSASLSELSSDITLKLDKVLQMCDVIENIKQMTDNLKNVNLGDSLKYANKSDSNVK